ncbi:MAG: hypothetical protein KF838_09250 [Phycisphaeraceae bacterium]|nr:MAG: hypothetical protein KF838_09250 [Phycisphaeraceae bacterium]
MRAFAWKRAILLFVAVAAIAVAIGSFCVGSPRYYSDKYSASPVAYAPLEYPGTFAPEKQVEPHTCGFHAISSVYRAYGLDPGTNRLRFRLGTDKRATNFDPESLGTLHPDMLRVLGQDGFDASVVLQPKSPESLQRLVSHIQRGHPAVALVRAPGLHWIVLAPPREHETDAEPTTLIVDSLQAEATTEVLRAFVTERVLSAVLIKPEQ